MVKISVVMSVYNGAATLAATLASIDAQTERDYELVVVDDGSSDGTAQVLRDAASRDPRIRVLTQANAGLTRALIRACDEARAPVIARHDCGDRSHPERLARQLALLEQGHVLVGCATRFMSAEGDTLYVSRVDGEELRRSLLTGRASDIRSLTHGTAMFRRDAYREAGGYRAEFRTAQDLDLWLRMAPLGTIAGTDEVLYDASFDVGGISGASRDAQLRLTEIAVALRDGGDAPTLLAEAAEVRSGPRTRQNDAATLYFIGKCLASRGNPRWRTYIWRALRRNPMHLRAWASLIIGRRAASPAEDRAGD